jgi:hypothetical protein
MGSVTKGTNDTLSSTQIYARAVHRTRYTYGFTAVIGSPKPRLQEQDNHINLRDSDDFV